jgi:NADH:ubiquinone oxidoreductase subunit E
MAVLQIMVCVGSSCHMKGSYPIIRKFEELIHEGALEDRVELRASFCMGNCTNGVSVKIGGKLVGGVTPETAEEVFRAAIAGCE